MVKVAVGIILRKNNNTTEVLLCQRKREMRYGLKWEFPGGKVESGERAEDCVRRELHEELGIEAPAGEFFHHQFHEYPDRGAFEVLYYLVPSFSGTIRNHACEATRWVPLAELPSYDILEGNRDVLPKLVALHE